MGFKIELITGILLFTLLICSSSGNNHRQTRQTSPNITHSLVNDNARNNTIVNKKKQNEIIDNNDKKLENDHKLLALDVEDVLKLPINLTTTEKTESNFKNAEVTKLKLSQPYKNNNNNNTKNDHELSGENEEKDEEEDFRNKENARSIDVDINKYVSPDFHNINNVFTLPISADTEKYLESDFDKKSSILFTTQSGFASFNSELTTPKNDFFDSKYKEAVQSIDQKLEHLDDLAPFVESEEITNHDHNKESQDRNLEQLILEHEKQPNSTLDYTKVKQIAKNDTKPDKNHLGKDLSVEESSKTRFESFYNDTKTYDQIETSTVTPTSTVNPTKVSVLSTTTFKIPTTTSPKPSTSRKISTLTKPPIRNNSHILSNKIDTEASKLSKVEKLNPKNGTNENTTKLVPIKEEASSTIKNVAITKRGSIKYIDSLTTTPLSIIRKNKSNEQVVQENKVYAVHVEPPETTTFVEELTTAKALETEETESTKEDSTTITPTTEIMTESSKSLNLSTTKRSYETTLGKSVKENQSKSVKNESIKIKPEKTTETVEESTTEEIKENTTVEMRFKDLDSTTIESSTIETSTTKSTTTDESTTTEESTTTTAKPILEEAVRTSKSFNITTVNVPETTENFKTTIEENQTTTTMSKNEEESTTILTKNQNEQIVENLTSPILETTSFSETVITDGTTKSLEEEEEARTLPNEILKSNKSNSIIDYVEEEHNKSDIINQANLNNNKSTTEIVFIHIENVDNHTTLHPEIVNPSYTYPPPLNIEDPINKNQSHLNAGKEMRKPEIITDNILEGDDTTETPTENGLTTEPSADNKGTIAAIVISTVGAICLILLAGLLYVMRKRQKRFNYGQRCTPVSLDDYSMDNISVYGSVNRRKGAAHRSSKRSYGNAAFDDPNGVTHPLNFPALAKFANNFEDIKAEYEDIPQIVARTSELPEGCETKNRYANVIPLPETRVFLQNVEGVPNSDYINANYVTGPKNIRGYYIACQAPMENTVDDFWRMVWEQESKVILMLTHLFENGIEKCVDYLPPSEVLDCHRLFGDFQITLKKRDVKEKYIISNLQLKNMVSNSWREVTHFWYLGWPEKGVPSAGNSLIAFLIEARSCMKTTTIDKRKELQMTTEMTNMENGRNGGDVINPVVVHCSPGTGRTGVVIACDIAIREFEQTRLVDIPKIVYKIRRDRANAVQTKEQYEFIYKVVSLYAAKLTGGNLDSI